MMMEPPTSLDDDSLRSNKVDLLKSIPPVESSDLVLGQYADGPNGKAYVDDDTVPDSSRTATFAQWAMKVDNERWRGVPVMVKCGKGNSCPPYVMSLSISDIVLLHFAALDEGLMTMTFHLRPPANNVFKVDEHSNSLVIRMNPEPAVFFRSNLLKPATRGTETVEDEIKWTVPGRKVAGDKLAYEGKSDILGNQRRAPN